VTAELIVVIGQVCTIGGVFIGYALDKLLKR
jgi:hypothetical protein